MATVLIVDDSPTEVHVLSGYLQKHGFATETAADGAEGIEKARALRPDLILMDVVMPGMNGFQATRELARAPETAAIPIIMVTTKGLETDKIWGMRQGARDYLVKPVTEAQLVEKVRAALDSDD
jgi:twitching motility two-component system response regulator PilH